VQEGSSPQEMMGKSPVGPLSESSRWATVRLGAWGDLRAMRALSAAATRTRRWLVAGTLRLWWK